MEEKSQSRDAVRQRAGELFFFFSLSLVQELLLALLLDCLLVDTHTLSHTQFDSAQPGPGRAGIS